MKTPDPKPSPTPPQAFLDECKNLTPQSEFNIMSFKVLIPQP